MARFKAVPTITKKARKRLNLGLRVAALGEESKFVEKKLSEISLREFLSKELSDLKGRFDPKTTDHLLASVAHRQIVKSFDVPEAVKRKLLRYMDAGSLVYLMSKGRHVKPTNVVKVLEVYLEALHAMFLEKPTEEQKGKLTRITKDIKKEITDIKRINMPIQYKSQLAWKELPGAIDYLQQKLLDRKHSMVLVEALRESKKIRRELLPELS